MDRQEDDLAMMQDPNRWPLGFMLPLKKIGLREMGFLYSGMDAKVAPVVILGSIYDDNKQDLPKREYADFEAIVDDGWMVD